MSRWTEPEQEHRVPSVNHGDTEDGELDKQEPVAGDEIGCKVGGFQNLADEFTERLGHGHPTETGRVPLTRPPSTVGVVVLKLTSKHQGSHQFANHSLASNTGNHTQKGRSEGPTLK